MSLYVYYIGLHDMYAMLNAKHFSSVIIILHTSMNLEKIPFNSYNYKFSILELKITKILWKHFNCSNRTEIYLCQLQSSPSLFVGVLCIYEQQFWGSRDTHSVQLQCFVHVELRLEIFL